MTQSLQNLAGAYWEFTQEISPTGALLRGDHRFDDQMEDLSRDEEDRQIAAFREFADKARSIPDGELSEEERVTRDVLAHEAHAAAEELAGRFAEFDVNPTLGFHAMLLSYVPQFPIAEPAHAEAMLAKYEQLGRAFTQAVHRLRQGVARGRTPHRSAVEKVIAQCDRYLASSLEEDPFVALPRPAAFDDDADAAWRDRLAAAVRDHVRPGYERYRTALADEVLPKARPNERPGLAWLPDGSELYDAAVRRFTTLPLTAMEVHDIGRSEIAGLEEEYRELGGRALGITDVAAIYERLRDDPALRFGTSEEVRRAAESALVRAREAITAWFGRLPEADCVVKPIPEAAADDATLAFYLPPAEDGFRPGTYFLNESEPTTRTRYESEALAFHEAIPGHHLQLAIAQELSDLPAFRRYARVTAYVEGWGLYAERLADEMGLYSGDLERLGILSFDSWRACRLVVDTGIHALGWSLQDAVDFMSANSPQARNNIVNEVERYIGWPGQALAYKIGQREIRRIRDETEAALGDGFDIRVFHDTVLETGPVPLPVLAAAVERTTRVG